jgi:hypothetical protein
MLLSLQSVAADEAAQPPAGAEPGSVVIEAEPPRPEPTLEERMLRLREQLATDRLLTPAERPLAGGLVEIRTRYGRFCLPSVTALNRSDLTGSFGLVARCAYY